MGTNNPYFPDSVNNTEEALNYLGQLMAAQMAGLYESTTGSPTLTATQMVGGSIRVSGGTTSTVTTATAAAIIARMQALNENAAIGSTFTFQLINDNSGTMTFTAGDSVTLVGATAGSLAATTARSYLGKWTGEGTVSLSVTA